MTGAGGALYEGWRTSRPMRSRGVADSRGPICRTAPSGAVRWTGRPLSRVSMVERFDRLIPSGARSSDGRTLDCDGPRGTARGAVTFGLTSRRIGAPPVAGVVLV